MKYLFIFNDSPFGTQRSYNGLRLAVSLAKSDPVTVFLLGDGILCGVQTNNPAHADYNVQDMLRQLAANGVRIGVCRTCMEARGISEAMLIPEAKRSTLDELTAWTEEAEKVITF